MILLVPHPTPTHRHKSFIRSFPGSTLAGLEPRHRKNREKVGMEESSSRVGAWLDVPGSIKGRKKCADVSLSPDHGSASADRPEHEIRREPVHCRCSGHARPGVKGEGVRHAVRGRTEHRGGVGGVTRDSEKRRHCYGLWSSPGQKDHKLKYKEIKVLPRRRNPSPS